MTSGDERNENLSLDFDKLYNDVASIRLHSAVPEKVQSYFASIQNLCLYGWYVYSFYALTEFLTYTCIEMALREKFKREDPKRAWSFKKLLGKAARLNRLQEDQFSYISRIRNDFTHPDIHNIRVPGQAVFAIKFAAELINRLFEEKSFY